MQNETAPEIEVEEVYESPLRATVASAPCRMSRAQWGFELKLLNELLLEEPRNAARGVEHLNALGDVMQRLCEHAHAVHLANLQRIAPDVGAEEARRRLEEQRARRQKKAR